MSMITHVFPGFTMVFGRLLDQGSSKSSQRSSQRLRYSKRILNQAIFSKQISKGQRQWPGAFIADFGQFLRPRTMRFRW